MIKTFKRLAYGLAFVTLALGQGALAADALVVALGASNTYGKGVSRAEAYPAQLEQLLRAAGQPVKVLNRGINGDTTRGMLARLKSAVPNGTRLVLLQPGGNDARQGQEGERAANIDAIEAQLAARNIKVILLENSSLHGYPHQSDGMHLTPEGYHDFAANLVSQVESALH